MGRWWLSQRKGATSTDMVVELMKVWCKASDYTLSEYGSS
jgi:hypothetical protein